MKCSDVKKEYARKIGVESLPKTSLIANFVRTSAFSFAKEEKTGEIKFI
jgi:hypothetical protein